jgi:3-dehydroquinate dehydratase / shikimate dehydrogenase
MIHLETERLIMRGWIETDIRPFAAMNQDERIMEYFPFHLNEEESLQMIGVFCDRMQDKGHLYLPLIEKDTGGFVGIVNLAPVSFVSHFTPATEIGWRLAFDSWGRGYATEAAKKLIEYGFNELHLDQIVSFTTVSNERSSAVMQRLGMTYDGKFDHPSLPEEDPLRRHALYSIKREA